MRTAKLQPEATGEKFPVKNLAQGNSLKRTKRLQPWEEHLQGVSQLTLLEQALRMAADAERRLAAADARLVQARRALYPSIGLTASSGRSSEELADLLKGDFSVWSLAANLTQPLFQGDRLRGGVELAEANADGAVVAFARSVLRALVEVETALAAEGYLASQEAALSVSTEEALAARRLAEDRYQRGLSDLITMLDSQRRAFDAQSRFIAVRRQRLDNRLDLHLALGGSFGQSSSSSPESAKVQ